MKEILLTQEQVALIDDQDFEWLSKYKWHSHWNTCTRSYSAARSVHDNGKQKKILMHRVIMGAHPEQEVDHRNHDTLDNQRDNLRLCTAKQNKQNVRPRTGCSSKYKGVSWHKKNHNWRTYINLNGSRYNLGSFINEIEAAHVYDGAARKLFGEFAFTNFPGGSF